MLMNLSYWEYNSWFEELDFAIVGSGIVGLSCALELRAKNPEAKIVVFERGVLPSGASSKNAGFACFGSVSEILEDLKTHSQEDVMALIRKRVEGLHQLRALIGDEQLDYKALGGYELFTLEDEQLYESCRSKLSVVNELVKEAISTKKEVFSVKNDPFSFRNVQKQIIFNHFEAQLDTGKMMQSLIQKCIEKGIFILNSTEIESFSSKNDQILLKSSRFNEIFTKKLFIATNGFARQLINEEILPARAQVLITKPISNLQIKGTFHLDRGYYYFRNINDRILFGGGRNLNIKGETTTNMELTEQIQNHLEHLLTTVILPNTSFEIEQRWSGIMGVGSRKSPIVKKLEENVYCGIRLGGMGVAIGSLVGKELAEMSTT